ncbi:MAG: hypothetical protein EBZ69_02070, partial [Alphaproteobacteria bacterium]|nr:hypothetical protein [Alphaproteobacteria bacterium]
VNNNLREPVWGTDRPDALGELARTVATTRDYFAHLPDVTVRQGDQTQRINFGGMGREAFSALCDTLTQSMVRFQDQFEQQQRQQAAVVEQQMQLNSQLRETVQGLQTQTVAQKESGQMVLSQLSSGYAEWQKKQQQQDQQFVQIWQQLARALEQQFGDVKAQQQKLAALTAQMIHTPEQLKHATQQVGQLSERFSAGASQLQDQLSAATAVLRASAQLAAETHELSRTQLVDATHQVHVAEETIMQFLDTANEKLSLATELTQALANVCAEANDRLRGINAAHTSMVEGKDKLLTIVNETQAFRPELLARTVSAILSQLQQLGGQLQQLASDVKNIQQPGAQAASTRTQRTLERLTQLRDMLSADERADERKVGG